MAESCRVGRFYSVLSRRASFHHISESTLDFPFFVVLFSFSSFFFLNTALAKMVLYSVVFGVRLLESWSRCICYIYVIAIDL